MKVQRKISWVVIFGAIILVANYVAADNDVEKREVTTDSSNTDAAASTVSPDRG